MGTTQRKFKMKQLPPTAVEMIIADDMTGTPLAVYFQMNFEQFGALVVEITGNNPKGIDSFRQLMLEAFNRGAQNYSEELMDEEVKSRLASILTTPSGKLQ
jgi:hypothetical protein